LLKTDVAVVGSVLHRKLLNVNETNTQVYLKHK